jgi:CheY-like chemotaxis protein
MSDAVVALSNRLDTKVLLSVLAQVKAGDFTARMPLEWTGVAGKVADGVNEVMPGEHRRCIDAGANDYVPMPVDAAQLLAVLRPWLRTASPAKP